VPISPERAHHRARKMRLTQILPPGHPDLVEVDRDLAALRLEEYIARTLAAAPPLSDEQRTKLAELLKPVRVGARNGGDAA
jgi:hypothetical protein